MTDALKWKDVFTTLIRDLMYFDRCFWDDIDYRYDYDPFDDQAHVYISDEVEYLEEWISKNGDRTTLEKRLHHNVLMRNRYEEWYNANKKRGDDAVSFTADKIMMLLTLIE